MTKVLYISYDGMTDPLGQSQVLPYLKGLSKAGYLFYLVSFEKEERFEKYREHIQTICDDSGIIWHPESYTKKPPLLSTIKDVRIMRNIAFELHQAHNFSIVHCRSYISSLVGLKMKQRFGVKFLFDMRGFWADERIDGKIWKLGNPIFKLVYTYFKRKEIQFLNYSDQIVSLTHSGKSEILTWKKPIIHESKISVIPCCVDLELFNPQLLRDKDKIDLRHTLGISENTFILGYVGSIGTWYMLDEMLDYFSVLIEHRKNAVFLFITGENPDTIQHKAELKEIPSDKIIIKSTLHKDVPLHISIFDASIFFIRASYSKKSSSPTKQGEIMAMNIPLICNSGIGDTDQIVKIYNSGIIIKEFREKDYEKSIPLINQIDKNNLNAGANDYFSLEKGTAKYLDIYQNLLSKND